MPIFMYAFLNPFYYVFIRRVIFLTLNNVRIINYNKRFNFEQRSKDSNFMYVSTHFYQNGNYYSVN